LVQAFCEEQLSKDTGRILVIKERVENLKKIFGHGYVPRLLYVPLLPTTPKELTISITEARTKIYIDVIQKCVRNFSIDLPLLEPTSGAVVEHYCSHKAPFN